MQNSRHLLDVADAGHAGNRSVQRVRVVIRHGSALWRPSRVVDVSLRFTQIHESGNIARLVVIAPFVGDPHLDFVNRYAAGDIRQRLHRLFVAVAEEIT